MRDHLALTVCFSGDLRLARKNIRPGPRRGPTYIYIYVRSRSGNPVYGLYRQPYCHNFRDLGVKLHAQKSVREARRQFDKGVRSLALLQSLSFLSTFPFCSRSGPMPSNLLRYLVCVCDLQQRDTRCFSHQRKLFD